MPASVRQTSGNSAICATPSGSPREYALIALRSQRTIQYSQPLPAIAKTGVEQAIETDETTTTT